MPLLIPTAILEPPTITALGPWVGLALLGAFHGLNPAMGWLFAVALGLQQKSDWAVGRAVLVIAAGHAASLLVVAASLLAVGVFVPLFSVRLAAGAALLLYGGYKLLRYYRHPAWVGMNVSARDLFAWSFIMATAHGAGLMLAPLLLSMRGVAEAASTTHDLEHHATLLSESAAPSAWGIGLGVHSAGLLLMMLPLAFVAYKKVGVGFLRKAWLNLDLMWGGALMFAGALTLALTFLVE